MNERVLCWNIFDSKAQEGYFAGKDFKTGKNIVILNGDKRMLFDKIKPYDPILAEKKIEEW